MSSSGAWHIVWVGPDATSGDNEGDVMLYHPTICHYQRSLMGHDCDVQMELDNVGWMGLFPSHDLGSLCSFPASGYYAFRLEHVTHIGWEHTEYDTEYEVIALHGEGGTQEMTDPHPDAGAGPDERPIPAEYLSTEGRYADHLCPTEGT